MREFHRVTETLAVWQGYDPAVKVDCTSTARRGAEGWIVVDPIPLAPEAWEELSGGEPLALIALTSGNHARAAIDFQKAYGGKIAAPHAAQTELTADEWFDDGDLLAGELRAIALPGGAIGETAFHAGESLIVGDALIHLETLQILPAKYCEDFKLLQTSLGELLPLDFRIVCFAHGWPVVENAREKLAAVLSKSKST